MRVLVAGRNAKVLAITASTFATDLKIETAATRAESLALLQRFEFDIVIACERLGDGSGLEVLSQVAVNTPNTLRIFAARPATLDLLKGELGLFGLFRTLPYPINFQKLWAALNLARSCRVEKDALPRAATPAGAPADRPVALPAAPSPCTPKVRHVVLDSAWDDATIPLPAMDPPKAAPAPKPAVAQTSARIPESEAFKRALAKRNAARLQATAGGRVPKLDLGTSITGVESTKRRREPALTTLTMQELAELSASRRPLNGTRAKPAKRAGRRSRAAIFVGSGVFAAVTAAVLTFLMLSTNSTIARAPVPLMASATRPVDPGSPSPVSWQQPTAPSQPQAGMVRGDPTAPVATDLEVQAEATSEPYEYEPGHPGPPPPYAPPSPSEPPAVDWTGQVPDE